MNDDTGRPHIRRQWSRLRRGGILGACAAIAFLVAACSSSPPAAVTSSQGGNDTPYQALVSYSECMRLHGMPNFPDPTITHNGRGTQIGFSGNGINQNSPQFVSANNACKHLLPFGGDPQSAGPALLRYAVCMRSHGVPNFPDPIVNSHQVGFKLSGINPNSPQFKSAQTACRKYQFPGG